MRSNLLTHLLDNIENQIFKGIDFERPKDKEKLLSEFKQSYGKFISWVYLLDFMDDEVLLTLKEKIKKACGYRLCSSRIEVF